MNDANICECGVIVADPHQCPQCYPLQYIKEGGKVGKVPFHTSSRTAYYKAQAILKDISKLEGLLEKVQHNNSVTIYLKEDPVIRATVTHLFTRELKKLKGELEKL